MKEVITKSTIFAIFCYTVVGCFGYITFAYDPKQLTEPYLSGVVIIADYGDRWEVIIVK